MSISIIFYLHNLVSKNCLIVYANYKVSFIFFNYNISCQLKLTKISISFISQDVNEFVGTEL